MPIPPTMSLLSALALRDEWGSVQQFLSLADLGCLRAVSHELRATITPQALDQAAMKLIREQESPAIRRDDLRDLRFHPASQRLADEGNPASAVFARLHHAWKNARSGRCHVSVARLLPLMSMLDPDPGLARMNGVTATLARCHQSGMASDLRYFIRDGRASPLAFPQGLTLPRRLCALQLGVSRDFMQPLPGHWLLTDQHGRLHAYDAGSEAVVPLPMTRRSGAGLAISRSGRFVVMALPAEGGINRLIWHDRLQDTRQETEIQTGISPICQMAVTDQGLAYMASHQRGYVLEGRGDVEDCVFDDNLAGTFMLSPDEQFLIRSSYSNVRGDLALLDLRNGQEIILPRLAERLPSDPRTTPVGVAFSALNALVAILYGDGVVQLFRLQQANAHAEGVILGETMPLPESMVRPHIGFDGFDRIQVVYQVQAENEVFLEMKTLHIP